MAIEKLPIDFVDAVTSQQRYKVTDAGSGQVLVEDVSTYSVDGSYFGSKEINEQRGKVNETITLSESSESSISRLKSGSIIPTYVTSANTVNSATTAESVDFATTATNADYATTATSATTATRATTAGRIAGATINGVNFNGTTNIEIVDDSRLPSSKAFILATKQNLTFTNKVCTITDNRVTANCLADVYFTNDCLNTAMKSLISVETSNHTVTLTAGRTPDGTLTASIFIRVVE